MAGAASPLLQPRSQNRRPGAAGPAAAGPAGGAPAPPPCGGQEPAASSSKAHLVCKETAPNGNGALFVSKELRKVVRACVQELTSRTPHTVAEVADELGIPEIRHILSGRRVRRGRREADCCVAAAERPRAVLALAAVCVVLAVSRDLLANWENETKVRRGLPTPSVPLVILVKNLASVLAGIVLAFAFGGRAAVVEALDPRKVVVLLPMSTFVAASQISFLTALKYFDAGSLAVFARLSLPAVAVLSRFLLRRRLSQTQWQAIAFLTLCSVAFIEVRILFETGAPSPVDLALRLVRSTASPMAVAVGLGSAMCPGGPLEGLGYVLVAVCWGSAGSVLGERFFLKRDQRPFYLQKCSLMLGESIASLAIVLTAPGLIATGESGGAWRAFSFAGWDWRTSLVVLVWGLNCWVTRMVVNRLSAVTKSAAHLLSAMLSYGAAAVLWPRTPLLLRSVPATLTAALAFICVFIFATLPEADRRPKTEAPRDYSEISAAASSGMQTPLAYPTRPLWERFRRELAACSARPAALLSCPSAVLPAFVVFEAVRPLLVSWAQQGHGSARAFMNGTFVLAQTLVSFLVAWAIASAHERDARRALALCAAPATVLRLLPMACCFSVSKLALLFALAHLDAGTVRVMAQGGVPMIAVGSSLMGKRYTRLQWQAIWMIGLGVLAFFLVKTETERDAAAYAAERPWPPELLADDSGRPLSGAAAQEATGITVAVLCVLLSLGANCLGALFSERFLKRTSAHTPYYAQKAHLLGGECAVNFAICLGSWLLTAQAPEGKGLAPLFAHLSSGWDHRTFITMLVWIPSGWCATMVVRCCSVLSKNIAQSVGSLLTYLLSLWPVTLVGPALEPTPVVVPVFLLALVCLQSVVLFVIASAEQVELKGIRVPSRRPSLQPSMADAPQASSRSFAGRSWPVVPAESWDHEFGDPVGQIDFAGVYSPLLGSLGVAATQEGPPDAAAWRPAVAAAVAANGASEHAAESRDPPGFSRHGLRGLQGLPLQRVSTLGAELVSLADTCGSRTRSPSPLTPSRREVQFPDAAYPIGQTEENYLAMQHLSSEFSVDGLEPVPSSRGADAGWVGLVERPGGQAAAAKP